MTAYNREAYIGEAIASVVASDFEAWELIIVDDGSTDRTVSIAREWADRDVRIRVYQNPKNLGDYPNRNQAASYARGKYLKYVDADDYIYPHGLTVIVAMMEKFPEAGYGLCSLDQDLEKPFPFQLSCEEAYQRHYFEQPLFHKAPLSSIIRRDIFEKVGGFTGKQHLGDFELWNILSQTYPVVLMPNGVVWYREHDDQQSNDNKSDPFVPFKYLLCTRELLSSPGCPLELNERKQAIQNNQKSIARSVIGTLKRNGFKKHRQLKIASNLSYLEIISII